MFYFHSLDFISFHLISHLLSDLEQFTDLLCASVILSTLGTIIINTHALLN